MIHRKLTRPCVANFKPAKAQLLLLHAKSPFVPFVQPRL